MRILFVGVVLGLMACAGEAPPSLVAEPVDREPLEVMGLPNPGQVRLFLYAPSQPKVGAGLVVALHGCAQTAADFQRAGWSGVAEREGFYVLYAQAASPSGCFRWFEPAHASRGEGETASLVAGVDWVLQRYAVDRRRVFVTGLSAGAAMGAALLASSPDVFSGGALFAGVPAGCASTGAEGARCMTGVDLSPDEWAERASSRWPVAPAGAPRVQVWTGSLDTTVAPTMARELVEQWTRLNGLGATPTRLESAGRVASEEFSDARGLRVQAVVVSGMGHAVPIARGCGASGPFIVDADVCGAQEAARFFGLLADDVQGPPVEVLDAGVELSDAGVDAGVATPTCREAVATPTWHLWLRHGEVCGFFRSLVCGVGSGELLGALASAVPVTAHAVNGEWRAGPCR